MDRYRCCFHARVGVESQGRGLSFTATEAANTQVLRTDKN